MFIRGIVTAWRQCFIYSYQRCLFSLRNNSHAALMHRDMMFNDAVPVFSARLCIERHALCSRNAALKRLQDGFRVFLPNQSRSQCLTWTGMDALLKYYFFNNVFKNLVRSRCHCEPLSRSHLLPLRPWLKSTYAKTFALIQRMNMNVLWFLVTWNCFKRPAVVSWSVCRLIYLILETSADQRRESL